MSQLNFIFILDLVYKQIQLNPKILRTVNQDRLAQEEGKIDGDQAKHLKIKYKSDPKKKFVHLALDKRNGQIGQIKSQSGDRSQSGNQTLSQVESQTHFGKGCFPEDDPKNLKPMSNQSQTRDEGVVD